MDYSSPDMYAPPPPDPAFAMGWMILWLVLLVAYVIAGWKIFQKAKKPGWAAIIPVYNIYVLLQVAGLPGWWVILFFIPFINIVISLLFAIALAKSFGKSEVYGIVALWLFSFIGMLMLGFSNAKYIGPGGKAANKK
jgi:hypothetical protein